MIGGMLPLFPSAKWIQSPVVGGPRTMAPSPYFRKSFTLSKPVREARLQITALGLYEAEINGRRVGDQVFAPGWTEYRKRVPVQIHDVTDLLQDGENVLGVILGDGWYCGYVAWLSRQQYGERPMLLASLEVTLEDGSQIRIDSDTDWKTETGPILSSDLLQGESYDARLELGTWSSAGYDDSNWRNARPAPAPQIELTPSKAPPVRRIEELSPIHDQPKDGWPSPVHQFDFGQNFSGRVRVKVQAPRGTTLTIRYAEILEPGGTLYTENLRTALVTDHYTCKGDGEETFEPRFTFHGFRHVSIAGASRDQILEVTGIVLHSDTPPTGFFSCSHPLLNQLQHNIVWGQKSNFLEVPTDCPQRDERLGWTGDAQVFIRTACFNMDVRDFFHKWMQDVRDAQTANGGVPPVIPDMAMNLEDGGPAWADVTIICPWTIYLCYGDTRILSDHYDSMVRYMDFLAAHRCKDLIRSHPDVDSWGGFGDWLALDGSGKTEGGTPRDLIGTALYAYDAELMAKIARVLGKDADAAAYEALHEKIVRAFQDRFLSKTGLITSGTQTAYVLALHFGLVPEDARANAVRELVRNIEKNGFHLATGFVGTPYLLDVLENNGHLDLAYKLLEQESFPSWLFPIKNGATTIWERWDGWTPEKGFQSKGMNSFNHYAYGAVGDWMYRSVAGLDLDPEDPGYGTVVFRPRPGGSITHAEARLQTLRGEAGIRWELKDDTLEVDVTVPEGSKGRFSAPEGYVVEWDELGAGRHRIVLKKR
jgi:alpha-L-rhamnosidase